MKKRILPSILIGTILFLWQFISWAAVNFHSEAQQYTPNQDTIMNLLNNLKMEDGRYMLPSVDPKITGKEAQEQWQSFMGKPWVFISYHQTHNMSMGVNMIRGLLVDIVAGFLLISLFNALGPLGLGKSIAYAVGISIVGFFNVSYTNHIWYPTFDLIPTFIDAIAPFILIGVLNALIWNKMTA
jgi:hypothetical protein